MPKLVITDIEGSKTVGLDRELKAGRLADNDIPLKVPEASRHHCRFFQEQSSWFVEDMGSSNGTLVNGRKVSKFELQDGDLIAVGAVTLRFLDSAPTAEEKGDGGGGWGDEEISLEEPEERPVAVATAAAEREESFEPQEETIEVDRGSTTKLLDSESAFADPSFALSEIPEKKSVVPSILAVVLLLALAGGAAWLWMNRAKLSGGGAGDGSPQIRANNLVPRKFSSFESNADATGDDQAGWHKEDPIDPASVGEIQDPVHSGDQAFSIARQPVEKGPAATWVSLSGSPECEISILPGSVYRLGAAAQLTKREPVPGVVVTWIEPVSGEDAHEIAREVVPIAPASKKWAEASGFVQAPEGASAARIGLVSAGTGDVAFDDVVFDLAQPPAGRAVAIKDFRAWLTPSGALRIFRFRRTVSDGIGVWKATEGGLEPPWRNFVPNGSAGDTMAGTLRDGGGNASVALAASESTFRATWQLPGGAAAYTIAIPLPGNPDEVNVTLLDGDRAKRMRAAFQKAQATGVIIGGQGDRVRIKFVDAEKKPVSMPLDFVTDSGRAFVKLDRGDKTSITFEFETSFDAEMAEARGLLASAEEAARKGQAGAAMATYEQVLAKFPFDEALEKDASKKLELLANDGRNKLKTLAGRVDDAKFFRTARMDDDLLNELETDATRYAGTNLAAEFAAKRDDLKDERAKTAKEKWDAAARGLFERGLDYWESKPKRRELSIKFLEMCIARYPETEWAQQARALLEQITGNKPESKPESAPASKPDNGPESRTEGPR